MSTINRSQLSSRAYPPGEYKLLIEACEHVEGIGKNSGEKWEKINLRCKIVEPEHAKNRKLTTSLWYDNRLGKLIEVGLGMRLDDVFGKNDQIDQKMLFDILEDSEVRVRLGVKGDFNEISEFLPPLKNEKPKVEETV